MKHLDECLSVIRPGEPCNCVCKKHHGQRIIEWFAAWPPKPSRCAKCINDRVGLPKGHEVSEEESAVKP